MIEAELRHQGIISIVRTRGEVWKLKGVTDYGINLVSFMFKIWWNHWYIVGAYIHPIEQP